jgi:hypothetical protein
MYAQDTTASQYQFESFEQLFSDEISSHYARSPTTEARSAPGVRRSLQATLQNFTPPCQSFQGASIIGTNAGLQWSSYAKNPCLMGCTTVMVQHIPGKITQRKLVQEVDRKGFSGLHDFLYLPLDSRNRANRGFAFVNFTAPEHAERFRSVFDGQLLHDSLHRAKRPLAVVPADVQGFEENLLRYINSRHVRRSKMHSPPVCDWRLHGHAEALKELISSDLSESVKWPQLYSETSSNSSDMGLPITQLVKEQADLPLARFCSTCGQSLVDQCCSRCDCRCSMHGVMMKMTL